jgi:ABC-type branched-subunit amino acid transport system ATPase component
MRLDRPQRRRQDDLLQPADQVPDAHARADPVQGHDITRERPAQIARRGVIRSFQISATFPHLTVLENVRVALQHELGVSFHFWRSERVLDQLNERALELLDTVGLRDLAEVVTVELPYGRKRALEIATTLAMDPKMMLLDEPTQGMGHEDVELVTQLIKKVAAHRTVLMVEHNMNVVASIADRITVLARGAGHRRRALRGGVEESGRCWRPTWAAKPPSCRAPMDKGEPEFLSLIDVHAFYGESHILHGIDLTVNRGEVVTLLGPQRRRPHDDAEGDPGPGGPAHRLDHDQRPEAVDLPPHRIAHLGHRLLPRGARHLRQPHLRGEPDAAAGGGQRRHEHRRDLRDVPQPEGAPQQPGAGCRAASSRCCRWRASCAPGPSCCCSTRSPKAWRR